MIFKKSITPFCISLLILLISLFFSTSKLFSCTVFNKSNSEKVLFGNVENNWPASVAELHFNPANKALNSHGNFLIILNGLVAGGMNDMGLCFDVAALPLHDINTDGKTESDIVAYLMKYCSTVDQALQFFESKYWAGHNVNHLMVMDKSGASAIIEHIGNTVHIFKKEAGSQVMTNYSVADPEIRLGEYPCPRFMKVSDILDTAKITISNFQRACESVNNAYYNAIYANIFDPVSLDIHFFNANIPGSEIFTFNMLEEFSKGAHFYTLKNHQIISSMSEIELHNFSISDNYPNPFTSATSFSVQLKDNARLSVTIVDMQGREVEVLENQPKLPGLFHYTWNSDPFPAGVYFCRIRIDGIIETRKWIRH